MHLRLHEIVEAGDSGISFDTCLADEASSAIKKVSAPWSLQAAKIADRKTLGKFGAFLLDADFGRHAKLMIKYGDRCSISSDFPRLLNHVARVDSHEMIRNEL